MFLEEEVPCLAREFRTKMWEKLSPDKASKEQVQADLKPISPVNHRHATFLTAKSRIQADLAACNDLKEWMKMIKSLATSFSRQEINDDARPCPLEVKTAKAKSKLFRLKTHLKTLHCKDFQKKIQSNYDVISAR